MTKTSPRKKFLYNWFLGIFYFLMGMMFFSSLWSYDVSVYQYVVDINPMVAYIFLAAVITFVGSICTIGCYLYMEDYFEKATNMLDKPENRKTQINDNTKNPYRLC
jgi:hypothetical protein